MSQPTIEDILAPKPEARPCIYAYSIDDQAHKGLLKVGQTMRDVKQRVGFWWKIGGLRSCGVHHAPRLPRHSLGRMGKWQRSGLASRNKLTEQPQNA